MNYFKKGAGEFLGFSLTAVMLLVIMLVFVTLSNYLHDITAIQSSSAIVARSIVIAKDKSAAQAQAQVMAERLLNKKDYKNISNVKAKIHYTPGCKKWEKGAFVLVDVEARVKTYGLFRTRNHKHTTMVMIERNSEEQMKDTLLNTDFSSVAGSSETEKWLACCEAVRHEMLKNHFRYSRNNNRKTYDKALETNRTSNCNYYISWALQDFGALKKGEVIYLNQDGSIGGSGASHVNNSKNLFYVKRMSNGITIDNADLQPGDIVGFEESMHSAVYGGESNGKKLWYSAGSKSGCDDSGNFDEDKFKLRKIYNGNERISVIVRLLPKNVD